MMNVKELIEELSKLAPDAPVFARGYENGWDPIETVSTMVLEENKSAQWYDGAYEEHGAGENVTGDGKLVNGVVLK